MRGIIKLGELEFKTKKSAYEYMKRKIYELGECVINTQHPEFQFFKSVTKRKLESLDDVQNKEVKEFILFKTVLSRTTLHLKIKMLDDTERVISWKDCSTQCNTIMTTGQKLNSAMRIAIYKHAQAYKQTDAIKKCVQCSTVGNLLCDNLQIDHIFPFHRIKIDFLKTCVNKPPEEFDKDTGRCIFKSEDEEFENEWREYHNKKAT